jgi:flagellar basal-body rod protein FlgG
MPFQTIYSSGSGMLGMEKKLNVISNNLANLETTGFKKQICNFEDLYYDNLRYPGSQDVNGEFAATGIAIGTGTRVTSVQTNFAQGAVKSTERDLDLCINGDGFFQCTDAITGEIYYTRSGNLNINSNGQLVIGSAHNGRPVEPAITITDLTKKIQITSDGRVFLVEGEEVRPENQVGQLELATFINPEGLYRAGENMYRETDSSGAPIVNNPENNNAGIISQGYLESSNVSPVVELVDMITSQRAYEMNSKSTQTGDQLLQTVISIKR